PGWPRCSATPRQRCSSACTHGTSRTAPGATAVRCFARMAFDQQIEPSPTPDLFPSDAVTVPEPWRLAALPRAKCERGDWNPQLGYESPLNYEMSQLPSRLRRPSRGSQIANALPRRSASGDVAPAAHST